MFLIKKIYYQIIKLLFPKWQNSISPKIKNINWKQTNLESVYMLLLLLVVVVVVQVVVVVVLDSYWVFWELLRVVKVVVVVVCSGFNDACVQVPYCDLWCCAANPILNAANPVWVFSFSWTQSNDTKAAGEAKGTNFMEWTLFWELCFERVLREFAWRVWRASTESAGLMFSRFAWPRRSN